MEFLGSKTTWFWILGVLVAVLAIRASQLNPGSCQQRIFKLSKKPLQFDITKQVLVDSVLECAHLCKAEKNCEAFRHRNVYKNVNCQVTQGQPKVSKMPENNDKNEKWTLYIIKKIESPECVKKNLCKGAGRCLVDSCSGPDGFKCECFDKYCGKYCQYDCYDYDINLEKTMPDNFIDVGTINKNFNQFTFSAWIKFDPGFIKYPLVSYVINATEIFALGFRSDITSGTNEYESLDKIALSDDTNNITSGETNRKTIAEFFGNLLGHHIRENTIPINDGYWHHVGFAWSGVTGDWILLIDGVLWATRNFFTNMTIPSGGVLTIGKVVDDGVTYHLVGKLNRVNLWSTAKTGSRIEEMAKSPGSRDGDLISWSTLKDLISDRKIIRPSSAAFSGNSTNYDITLPLAVVNCPGPSKSMNFLSSCFWYYSEPDSDIETQRFFSYDGNSFLFGISSETSLSSKMNGFSSSRTISGGLEGWHFLCIQWDGIEGTVAYFYDGYIAKTKIQNEMLKTELPKGSNFSIGLSHEIGTMTQLNIWDYELAARNIIAMSAGGFNIHGSVLSWSSLTKYVPLECINWNTEIYLPGFKGLARRTRWCNDYYPSSSCTGELLARLGGYPERMNMKWRCYCPSSLLYAKFTYNFSTKHPFYYNGHSSLIALN